MHLETTPDPYHIELMECFQPSIQSLYGCTSVVNDFPLRCLDHLGDSPSMGAVGINDGLSTELFMDDCPQVLASQIESATP